MIKRKKIFGKSNLITKISVINIDLLIITKKFILLIIIKNFKIVTLIKNKIVIKIKKNKILLIKNN